MQDARPRTRLDVLERFAAARPVVAAGLLLLVAWLSLLWPALLNRQPMLFHDTTAYIRGAAFPAEKLLGGVRTVWSTATAAPASQTPPADQPFAKSASSVEDKTVFAGRSVYYGALLFGSFVVGGLWLAALLQASIAAAAVFLALRLLVARPFVAALVALPVLGVATPLSWFSGYLMPDLFAGLGVLAAALLLGCAVRMQRWDAIFWFALLAFALAAHTSHLATAAALLATVVGVRLAVRHTVRERGVALVAAAIGIAVLADLAFGVVVARLTGASPIRPPMLTARVMQSETGRASLQAICARQHFAVCAFVDRPPMTANDFLWSPDPVLGVFSHADAATRRALSDEQMRLFALAAIEAPWDTLRELVTRCAMLLAVTDIPEFNHTAADRAYFAAKLPSPIHDTFATTPSAMGRLPVAPFQSLFLLGMIAGVIVAVLRLRHDRDCVGVALVLGAGLLINAAICSALSGVEPRYETRMIWLVPFLGLVLAWRAAGQASHRTTPTPMHAAMPA